MSGFIGYSPTLSIGFGWAAKRRGQQQVVACCAGDGTYSQGRLHESLIFANNDKLPIVYLCENNGMNQLVSTAVSHPVEDFADLAKGYGMPGVVVDGHDVFAVANVALQAIQRARNGEGPTLIEAKTLRAASHAVGMPDRSGTEARDAKNLEAQFESRNPLALATDFMLAEGIFSDDDIEQIKADAVREFDAIEAYCDQCEDASLTEQEMVAQVYAPA